MEELRPDDLAWHVAAWHNRHPLARRITPEQVQGMGWVALPFVIKPGAAAAAEALAGGASQPPWSAGRDLPVLTEAAAPPAAGASGGRLRDRVRDRLRQGMGAAAKSAGAASRGPAAVSRLSLLARIRAWLAAERQAWVRSRTLRPAFSEDFIAPLGPRQVARWALRHGKVQVNAAGHPLRNVMPDAQWTRQDAPVQRLFVPTAAVELGSRRARLLLTPQGAVYGPRLLSPLRGAIATLPLLAGALVLVLPNPSQWPWPAWPGHGDELAVAPEPMPAASAALATVSASASARAAHAEPDLPDWTLASAASTSDGDHPVAWPPVAPPGEHLQAQPGAASAASAPADGLAPAADASASANTAHAAAALAALPPDDPPLAGSSGQAAAPAVTDGSGSGRPGTVVPLLSEAAKAAARQAVADARAAAGLPSSAAAVPVAARSAAPTSAAPAPQRETAAAPAAAPDLPPAWALTTRALRTRAESEQIKAAVSALLAQHTREPLKVELIPVGDDWRVVCWPFLRREDAQLARALLLSRGLRLEPMAF